jgi:hypothetical protein
MPPFEISQLRCESFDILLVDRVAGRNHNVYLEAGLRRDDVELAPLGNCLAMASSLK